MNKDKLTGVEKSIHAAVETFQKNLCREMAKRLDEGKLILDMETEVSFTTANVDEFIEEQIQELCGTLKPIVIKQTCTLTWTKLEKGSVATPYVPKAFDDEFLECLRYFVGGVGIGSAGIVSGSTFRVLIPTPVPMRTAPSVTVKVADNVVYNGTFKALNTTVSNITRQRNGIHLHIGMAASGVNNYPGIAYGLQCDLSADL